MSDAALYRRICCIKRIDKLRDFIQVGFPPEVPESSIERLNVESTPLGSTTRAQAFGYCDLASLLKSLRGKADAILTMCANFLVRACYGRYEMTHVPHLNLR